MRHLRRTKGPLPRPPVATVTYPGRRNLETCTIWRFKLSWRGRW